MNIFALKLDAGTHDLIVSGGAIVVISDSNVIARNLESRLQMLKGEWILDTTYGYDFTKVFGQRIVDLQIIETTLKSYILATEGVVTINTFKLDYDGGDNRLLKLTFSVKTIYSDTITIGGLTIG